MKSLRIVSLVLLVVLLGTLLTGCGATGSANNYPEKPITIIVHAAAGGGSDIMARSLADNVAKNKLLSQPIVVENKPGGSGAVAMSYVANKKGEPYFLLTAVTSFLTTPLMGTSEVNYKNFTPIANFAFDQYMIMVNVNSKYKTVQDLVTDAKARPKAIMAGGTQMGSSDTICTFLLEKAAGVKFNYITFNSGGEVNTALLGGHVDFALTNPGEALSLMQGGKVRILGVYADKRLALAPDIPTMKEQGFDVSYVQNRGLVAPAGISADAVKVLETAFQKAMQTAEWKQYVKDNMLDEAWMNSADFGKWLENENGRYVSLLKEMGVTK